jgi:recombination DNA repair RAD52 pathway protein
MLTEKQKEQLLKPLNPVRVAKRAGGGGRQLSYLEAWDVKAHLIRIFGFGGWSWDVTSAELVFEQDTGGKWSVGYKVIGSLHIPPLGCTYTEAAIGSSILPQRGEAHDMAVKTAESDAIKRAAINLGDQFGLSLYNNGSTAAVVGQTLAEETE